MSTDDRRAPGATRVPFEALVEVGGSIGPSFEAQAIDVSEDGMHLRTAYLPEIGQPLSCRFDAGAAGGVIASGEVVWKQEAGKGGEFGIRFTDLDAQSADALQKMMGVGQAPHVPAKGNRVRLHIEGLGSPMRAHVKESSTGKVTAFSGLGFLQVGKHLELEDATTGNKRPARVVRVECELDPESRVPQLVMSFQYDDETPVDEPGIAKEDTPEPMVTHGAGAASARSIAAPSGDDDEEIAHESGAMKGFLARNAAKVTPALHDMFARAKTTMAVLAAKRRGGSGDDVAIPLRRRTSPPPQGGLHASGRKVVRDSMPNAKDVVDAPSVSKVTPKRIGIAVSAVGVVAIAAFALHKPAASSATASTDPAAATTTVQSGAQPLGTAEPPLSAPPSVLAPVTTTPPATSTLGTANNSGASDMGASDSLDDGSDRGHKRTRVAPFSNGAVSHGNVLRIKMDGPIEKIEGDANSTGFAVVLPGRRSLEPAAPLAARDSRIASIRVTNDAGGADLSLAFKDGVPNYLVRAKGDTLEIVLAPQGSLGEAPKPAHAAPGAHHHKKKH